MEAQQDPSSQWDDIDPLICAGQKIQAIKLYREATGAGLAESKQAVEAREAELRVQHPERFAKPGGGCMSVIVLGAGLILMLAWLSL